MRIPINKEIEEAYKDQFIRGFSVRETGYIALALCIIFGVAFLVWHFFRLPINFCAYVGIPFGIPALLVGFKKYQGLTVTEYIKEIMYENKIKVLLYDADELPKGVHFYIMVRDKKKKGWRR